MTRAILTCSPLFIDPALNEIRRFHPESTVLQVLAPGILLLQTPQPFDQLTAPWRQRLPIYLHHLCPVHDIVPLHATRDDLAEIQRSANALTVATATVQVRCVVEDDLPYSLAGIQEVLTAHHFPNPAKAPTGQVLSVLVAGNRTDLRAYLGVSRAAGNISPWVGGQIPITEAVSNRAGYKLLEALATFAIRLRQGDHALDLGAAPGAWTTLLRRRGMQVTAVAPTPLYPWLAFDPGVHYQPMLAETYLEKCQTVFDLIVNDMKMDGQPSARLMVYFADHLRSEGIAIMTLKLRKTNRQRVMDHAFRILRNRYKVLRVRQLVSNRQEVTLFLRRKD